MLFLSEEIRKSECFKNCQNTLILGVDLCLASGIFLNSVPSNQGDHYLAKYRPIFLGTQFACLRPGRSETVSSPSDTGDWIIQSRIRITGAVFFKEILRSFALLLISCFRGLWFKCRYD